MTIFKQYNFAYYNSFDVNSFTGTIETGMYVLGRTYPVGTLSIFTIFNLQASATKSLYMGGELYKQSTIDSVRGYGPSNVPLTLHFMAVIPFSTLFYWTAGANVQIVARGIISIYEPKVSAA